MRKRRDQLQGFIAGILVVLLLLPMGTAFGAPTWTSRDITVLQGGIRLVVNGQEFTPRDAQGRVVEPLIFQGSTFVPLRAVGEALGYPVDWDGSTTTVYIGRLPQGTPFLQAAPWFERSSIHWTITTATVNMLGQPFANAMIVTNSGGNFTSGTAWSHHSLNGQFTTLSGTIGRIDGSGTSPSTISFIGDGRELVSFTIDGNTHPTDISVDVTGVLVLRIQISVPDSSSARPAFANAMIQ